MSDRRPRGAQGGLRTGVLLAAALAALLVATALASTSLASVASGTLSALWGRQHRQHQMDPTSPFIAPAFSGESSISKTLISFGNAAPRIKSVFTPSFSGVLKAEPSIENHASVAASRSMRPLSISSSCRSSMATPKLFTRII